MVTIEDIQQLLADVLQLGERARSMDAETPLLGHVPEFDSMAVVTLITALEEQLDLVIEDDEITGEVFETVGSLHAFANRVAATAD